MSNIEVENHIAPATAAATSPIADATSSVTPASKGPAMSAMSAASLGKAGDEAAIPIASTQPAGQVDASSLTTIRTIANGIVATAEQPNVIPAAGASVPDNATAAAPAAARTMTLELSPANLGTVSVRLHVAGQTLDVELSVSSQETLGLVSRERDVLANALRDQSYDLNSLVIQSTTGATGASQDQYLTNQGGSNGGSNGGASADGGSAKSGGGGGAGQQQSSGAGPQADREEPGPVDGGVERSVGGVFV